MKSTLLLVAALTAGIAAPAFACVPSMYFPPTIDVPPITAPEPGPSPNDTAN